MRGGAIPARAEMWPAAMGQHRRCGRRGDRCERGHSRWRASTAGGAATGLWAVGQWAAGRRLVADGGGGEGQRENGARENETARGARSTLKHLISDGY
jgi:hypothetical protein